MTSRRPMTRSYSGNGRSGGSFSEEETSPANGRSENCNYLSNVRPENSYSRYSQSRSSRSTLFGVMAQLTEDTQPVFETTLKSKAVSENSNVKLTCEVTGNPAPDLKWYRDDMELDRYCGLPKYKIARNGKTHTLYIYNCTVDDAAIYQASASNSKGIVSCSGVLEVGTMSEFKIHQRFFAKLKQKAENKKRELEQSRRRGTDNIQKEPLEQQPLQSYPIPPLRKRQAPSATSLTPDGEENTVNQRGVAVEQPVHPAVEPNGLSGDVSVLVTGNGSKTLENEFDNRDYVPGKPPTTENIAKKKMKMNISNGVDTGVVSNSSNHAGLGNSENAYDGGLSLAQFLADSLSSQTTDETMAAQTEAAVAGEEIEASCADPKTDVENEKEREEKARGRSATERMLQNEQEIERLPDTDHKSASEDKTEAKTHSHDHHDHHHIQETLSNVLHSVKDFFFGKSKKDNASYDPHVKAQVRGHLGTLTQPTPPHSYPYIQESEGQIEVYETSSDQALLPMEVDGPQKAPIAVVPPHQALPLDLSNPEEPRVGITVSHPEKKHLAPDEARGSVLDSLEQNVCLEEIKTHTEIRPTSGSTAPCEAVEDQTQIDTVAQGVVSVPQESNLQVFSSRTDQGTRHQHTEDLDEQITSASPLGSKPRSGACHYDSSLCSVEDSCQRLLSENLESEKENGMHRDEEVPEKGIERVNKTHEEKRVEIVDQLRPTLNAVEERNEVFDFKTQEQPTLDLAENVTQDGNSQANYIGALPENVETISSNVQIEHFPVSESGVKRNKEKIYFESLEESCHTSIQDHLKITDVKTIEESPHMTEESMGNCDLNTKPTSFVTLKEKVEGEGNSECIHPLKKRSEKSSVGTLQDEITRNVSRKEQNASSERNEVPTLTIDGLVEIEASVDEINVEECKSQSEQQYDTGSANVPTEPIVTCSQANDINLGGYFGDIPEITVMDSALKVPEFNMSVSEQQKKDDLILIPNIEITEPQIKETLILITLNEPESEPVSSEKVDAKGLSATLTAENIAVIIDEPPTQANMWKDYIITEKIQEVSQPVEEVREQPAKTECLTLKDTKLIPTINVSFTEDSELTKIDHEHVKSPVVHKVKGKEAPKVPLFVAVPTSLNCEDNLSESKERPKNDNKDSESLMAMLRVVKSDFENDTSFESDKALSIPQKQTPETKAKIVTENLCSLSNKALLTKDVSTIIQKPEDIGVPETDKIKPLKDSRIESYIIGDEQRERTSIERLAVKPPTPPRSPSTLRRLMSRTPPAITVDDPVNNERTGSEQSGGDTPTSSLSCESSPRLKRRDSLTLIRSATPEELASGARRKIFIPREGEAVGVVVALGVGGSPLDTQVKKDAPYMSPGQARRAAFLQAPPGSQTPPLERRSPLLGRKKATLEVPKAVDQTTTEEPESHKTESKPPEKEKSNPFKAPQVIRKIRGEPFPDASGHLKLWCQFFNVLSDSTIKWFKDEEEIVELKRSAGDESQVALAVVQISSQDCGVYSCTITNEFGTDSTDFLLSVEILSEFFLREDIEVGEEIEMTPMLFTKGLADPGYWGDKFFGRIMTQEAHLGEGCAHKACRAKVIYGLDPVFESGSTCIMKVKSPIAYGTKDESNLAEKNMEMANQECKIQNTVREYCKIFSAEARVIENFGFSLEVSPLYLMYRPANSVPYATVEADLTGIFLNYCMMDAKGRLVTKATSEVEMKCCTFQHWIYQWTNGNLLITGLDGVGPRITKVQIVTKSKGYQGLTQDGSPKVFEHFLTQHQCNYYCGLLSLRTLKPMDTLQQPPKTKGSRSPLLNRKLGSSSPQLHKKLGSTSPQLQRKGPNSPLTGRKANSSPKVPRKTEETDEKKATAEPEAGESFKVVV
ncbi:hypothetical protein UPYG_G00264900 [Umbra pygmaea]|uniref:non-specific serine/threonine protein kinase n=1 Tax=Umbra pygmaea TaxID=75934 RepID=A0ABD0WVH4_UMBPY